tara:strand:- start:721 stop:1074 length:354 start_codon:yes stop_codon:yes gene_type:complete
LNIKNDNNCVWLNHLPDRSKPKVLNESIETDYLVVGAGYTGLSAARVLARIDPSKRIVIVDSQFAGEGASGRNSGYLVDTTLNDGFSSNKDLENYKIKSDIYKLGIEAVKNLLKNIR